MEPKNTKNSMDNLPNTLGLDAPQTVTEDALDEIESLIALCDDLIFAKDIDGMTAEEVYEANQLLLLSTIQNHQFADEAFSRLVRFTINGKSLKDHIQDYLLSRSVTEDEIENYIANVILSVYEGLKNKSYEKFQGPFRDWVNHRCEEVVDQELRAENGISNNDDFSRPSSYRALDKESNAFEMEARLEDIPSALGDLSGQSCDQMIAAYARSLQATFRAESCGIFLVPEDSSNQLVLYKNYSDKLNSKYQPVRVTIQSIPGAGLKGHIASEAKVFRLQGDDLRNHKYVARSASSTVDYLIDGTYHSLLAIPIFDRHQKLIGLISLDNKKGEDGYPGDHIGFDDIDESIGRAFAQVLSKTLERIHKSQVLHDFHHRIRSSRDRNEILRYFFQSSLRLSKAEHGVLTLYNKDTGILDCFASTYDQNNEPIEEVLDFDFLNRVWNHGNGIVTSLDIFPSSSKTKGVGSQIILPMKSEEHQLGILQLYSSCSQGFSVEDIPFYEAFASHVRTYAQFVEQESQIVSLPWANRKPPERVLNSILEGVRGLNGFDSGIIYIADYTEGKLVNSAYISGKKLEIDETEPFSYKFSTFSLATRVFLERRGIFVDDPTDTQQVNPMGISVFKIEGPVIGMPLIVEGNVVGVLVVWTTTGPAPTPNRMKDLEAFADLAAAHVALYSSGWNRGRVLHDINRAIRCLQMNSDNKELWRLLMNGILNAGFDRVRVYRFSKSEQAFQCIDSLTSSGEDSRGNMAGIRVNLAESWYSRDILRLASQDSNAHIYDPLSLRKEDPCADIIEKPKHLQWAVAPLVSSGKMLGQVAADNAFTGKKISNESIKYLTYYGALASHLMAKQMLQGSVRDAQDCLYRLTERLANKDLDRQVAVALIEEAHVFLDDIEAVTSGVS